jgi:fructokinase
VGVGVFTNNGIVHGLQHPEGGHSRVTRFENDSFKGVCPLHGDCLEGLVTNVAIKERKGLSNVDDTILLKDDDQVWELEGYYIAQLCLNLLYLYSIHKIVIGGGVINREILLDKIHGHFIKLNNKYLDLDILKKENIGNYIVRTNFKNDAGILSALVLYYD